MCACGFAFIFLCLLFYQHFRTARAYILRECLSFGQRAPHVCNKFHVYMCMVYTQAYCGGPWFRLSRKQAERERDAFLAHLREYFRRVCACYVKCDVINRQRAWGFVIAHFLHRDERNIAKPTRARVEYLPIMIFLTQAYLYMWRIFILKKCWHEVHTSSRADYSKDWNFNNDSFLFAQWKRIKLYIIMWNCIFFNEWYI